MTKQSSNENQLNDILFKISKLQVIDQGDLEKSFKEVTEAVAIALSIERVSIWFYNEQLTAITCADLYETKNKQHSKGVELKAEDFPSYFKYLSEERMLLANEVRTNPVTIDFIECYLKPLNIFSMLDAPIRVNGKMVGVICSEKTDEPKGWTQRDGLFVGNIADILARAIQAKERKEALEKLKEINDKLEKLVIERTKELELQRSVTTHSSKMALLGEMAGAIAHEINNPLAIILGSVKRMKVLDDSHRLTKEIRIKSYSDVEETTFRIVEIIKGLRFFARDASKDDFSEASIKQIVEDTLSLCKHRLRLSDCDLIVDEIQGNMKIKCQSVAISQALLNLINNSHDAIKEQSEKWIKIICLEEGENYVLRIEDSGKGVPEDLREKIMLPFFTTKSIGQGTGLGLSIVKGIIESHNGHFSLDEKAENTCFLLTLPKAA